MTEQLTEDLTDMSSSKITHAIVMVTPDMADRWLTFNTHNRKIRQQTVARYRADMEAGLWTMAADPIRFDRDGRLSDGQHRLVALSELPETVAIPFLVVRGLPPEAQSVMDQGVKRTPGDQLSLAGVKNANAVAAAVKKLLIWNLGLLFRDTKVQQITSPQIEQWVTDHPGDVAFFNSIWYLVRQNDAPPSVAGSAAIAFADLDPTACERFFTLLARGAGGAGHPITTLDKRLQRHRREGLKMPDRDYLSLFILAWNAWRDGKEMHKFQRPRGGRWSEANFPEPH